MKRLFLRGWRNNGTFLIPNRELNKLVLKALYLFLATVGLFLLLRHRAYDDPFITYRYAANLRQGSGFVYNVGERVQSTTTPLFTLLLAGLSTIYPNLQYLANLIGAFSLVAGGLLLWELADLWKVPWAGWSGLLLYPLFPLAVNTLGSETPLYIAFCLAAFVAYYRRRYTLAAICAALAVLTRPDGILVGIILAGDFIFHFYWGTKSRLPVADAPNGWDASGNRGRNILAAIPWKAVLLFAGLLLPWFGFAWVYFGSPIPVTLAAKQQQGAMVVSQRFAEGFITTLGWYKSWRYKLEGILALIGLVLVVVHDRQWLRFLAWPVVYFAAFSLLGVSRYFWYYTPLTPGFLLLAGLGLQALNLQTIRHSIARIPRILQLRAIQVLSFSLLAVLLLVHASSLVRMKGPDSRFAIYRAAGNWLAANTPRDASVGALEVGILGYYAHRPMVDFAGLIQPSVAAHLTSGSNYENAAMWAVANYQPNYLAIFQGDFVRLEQDYAAQHCRLEKKFQGGQYGFGKSLIIYNCQ